MTAPLDEKARDAALAAWFANTAQGWHAAMEAAIRAYFAASPSPSMEMEVVEGLLSNGQPLVTLSQAQSALAAMRADNQDLLAAADADAFTISDLSAQVLRLTEENEALRKERDGKEAEFRDKVALGATDAEILRFRDSYPNPAGGPKVFYRYTIEQARYRYADAVLSARTTLEGDAP